MESYPKLRRIRAWMIHIYTSLGLIVALLAVIAISNSQAQAAIIYLGIALFIDATDGAMARRWQVKVWAPFFDGRKLDDITDYINYAFIPAYFLWHFNLITGVGGMIVLGVMLLAGVYGFCQTEAKTSDGYFTGWPNFWNLVVFYLFLLQFPPEINGIIIAVCAALIFVPIKYVSFSTRPFRRTTRVMSLLYGIVLGFMVGHIGDRVEHALILLSMAFPFYYVILSLILNLKTEWQTNGTETAETESH
jgi:phosphatidylcholine synthase